MISALIWDVDGTLAETEEAHRRAFNHAFTDVGLDWNWTPALYRRLLHVTGGKERVRAYATESGIALSDQQVVEIHQLKTACYEDFVMSGQVSLRPGVAGLIESARKAGLCQAIATTTSRPNVDALITATLGKPADQVFDVIAAGDEVAAKKPAPDVYLLALERLKLPPEKCLALEDSMPGLASARAAGLRVLVTPSAYTDDGDFSGADWVCSDLTVAPELFML